MSDKPKSPRPKTPREITESSLRNIALYYLQRYASSRENLKRVLMRRVYRSAQIHDIDMEEASGWVEKLADQLAKSGVVDDQVYAEGRTRALFRRGVSPRGIAQRLQEKGVAEDIIEQVIRQLHEQTDDPKLLAAIRLAKRRRLGPFRDRDSRGPRFDKDLAALARAGFDYQTAHRVLSAASVDELQEIAGVADL
jgi:regulatory protein